GDDLGEVDEKIFEFFKQKREEFDFETKKYDTFRRKLENMKIELSDLKQKRHNEFMSGFRAINEKLKSIYSRITFGGNAELECLDYLDPFSEGIILSIMPPKKSWKPISNLSGGEKTLSSLALVFALHLYKPSPFYFMDEIDAALDFRNVSVIANFIKESDAQFIIVSLRNDMFEVCENLIGVYRHDGDSRIVCLNVGS
ncbi:Structural maintenance of chromosomes protein 4, partial [Dictyocoela roeselum]